MSLSRRNFLRVLAAGVVGSTVDPESLLWTPSRSRIFVPHPAQVAFFNQPETPMALWGIPYHMSNGSTGQWLGLSRGAEIKDELVKLIQILEKDKQG